ncbi:hypothetical protein KEM55_004017 [Ascosphaera atra]|nr:hypothetical protein KEM55_004017 [Ascosphaera atra]
MVANGICVVRRSTPRNSITGGYSSNYDTGMPTRGPLGRARSPRVDHSGGHADRTTDDIPFNEPEVPQITPKFLKRQLDMFVVGQERAKKVLSVAVFNHYQRVKALDKRKLIEEERWLMRERERYRERDDIENPLSTGVFADIEDHTDYRHIPHGPEHDDELLPLLTKSNILLFGPSGVGKTLMAKTLANYLDVPFSISDCTPLTQAGYIGEDVEACIGRLLSAARYDVEAAERGIIVLDEVDKIAASRGVGSQGGAGGGQKDVGGEGVQQALLKIIEGTTVQVQAKAERGAGDGNQSGPGGTTLHPHSRPGEKPPGANFSPPTPPGKTETFNVRTDNILFIFSGAFVGLEKRVMDRLSKGSIGFGQPVRKKPSSSFSGFSSGNGNKGATKAGREDHGGLTPILPGSEEEALYKEHLPYFSSASDPTSSNSSALFDSPESTVTETQYFNPLDLVTPTDLQAYGMIPELIGRIPVSTALTPLSHSLLFRILTEPKNNLVKEYTSLFALSNVSLYFTTPALHAIASRALKHSPDTGARSLRTVMENLLANAMFEVPGSSVRYVVVTGASVKGEEGILYFSRGAKARVESLIEAEEAQWKAERDGRASSVAPSPASAAAAAEAASYEEPAEEKPRSKAKAQGR